MTQCSKCANYYICHGSEWGRDMHRGKCKQYVSRSCANCAHCDKLITENPCIDCFHNNKWSELI